MAFETPPARIRTDNVIYESGTKECKLRVIARAIAKHLQIPKQKYEFGNKNTDLEIKLIKIEYYENIISINVFRWYATEGGAILAEVQFNVGFTAMLSPCFVGNNWEDFATVFLFMFDRSNLELRPGTSVE